jgi:hypothetical protein
MNKLIYTGGELCLYRTYIVDGRYVVESTALLDDEVKKLYEMTRRNR